MDTNAVQSVPKIMVVEDDPHVLRQIAFALEHEGYAVTTATAGDDALRQLMLDRPDLLVTDVMMPGLDGWDVLRMVRAAGKDVPVLFLTARDAANRGATIFNRTKVISARRENGIWEVMLRHAETGQTSSVKAIAPILMRYFYF